MNETVTLRFDRCEEAVLADPGYWISPEGEMFRVTSHVRSVWNNPERFGYTREELERIHERANEKSGSEGQARERIIRELVSRNWIRIRRYRTRWSVNVPVLSPRVCDILTRFASRMLGDGIEGIRESDPHQPVSVTLIPEDSVAATRTMHEIAAGALTDPGPGSGMLLDTSVPYSEISRNFPLIDGILSDMIELIPHKVPSLSAARAVFLDRMDRDGIDPYDVVSYLVDQMVTSIAKVMGVPVCHHMDIDSFMDLIARKEEVQYQSPI